MAGCPAICARHCHLSARGTAWRVALLLLLGLLMAGASLWSDPASAQDVTFPARPKPPVRKPTTEGQMLVQAREINYDYANERVAAVGNVQIFYNGSNSRRTRSSTTRKPSVCALKAMRG